MKLDLCSKIVLKEIVSDLYQPSTAVGRLEITRFEKINTDIYSSINKSAKSVVDDIEKDIREKQQAGGAYVLGVSASNTLLPIFKEFQRRYHDEGLSFKNVVVFCTHESFLLNSKNKNIGQNLLRSSFLDHVDIDPKNIYSPDVIFDMDSAQNQTNYEQQVQKLGGFDSVLLDINRIDMKTLLSAHKIVITAWGEENADIAKKMIEGNVMESVVTSYLQTHNNVRVVIDLSAASKLTRIQCPWLVTSCKWTNQLIRSALIWLCQKTRKPILKLTNKDYNENGLSELLTLYGSAYNVNIKVFNDLQHTITGWPGGKPQADDSNRPERALPFPKRVIVFSPHPDDDVISMGGTLQRLVRQGHEVHVAYETSGNIAVGDEEVVRFMHFINGFNQVFAEGNDEVIKKKYQEIKTFLKSKKDGDIDTVDVRTIKGLIRRGEARTASTYNQIPLDHVHFLDLPFYESGTIEKLPMGELDVNIVRNLLTSIKPHQIYVAGDLADPHGTHRKCTDAVLAALDMEKENHCEWIKDCRVWMYRGAWAEWDVENIEMCVPISPEELLFKRNSILKHQSQMESAPFLGNDERLFWQRAEERNRATAKVYDDLGLACYEAMEAFVEYKLF